MVVLDDLHFADEASLLALSYISRAVGDKRILIVCTHRDLELEENRRDAAPFSELVRPTLGIVLKGLPHADVRRMIENRRDVPPPEALVERIHQLTGGNPLFVSELLSLIEAEHGLDDSAVAAGAMPLPAGVRDAITARLAMLSPEGREMLSVASVIGQQFRTGTLAAAAGTPAVELLELLDEAVRLRLVRPTTQYADGYGFHHGLIQATLYDAIPRGRRLALHDAVARALEQDPAVVAGEGLAEIAHHYLEAAPAHDPQRAIEYARRAGDRAMATFAYDEAVGMYRGALGVTGLTESQRGELLQAARRGPDARRRHRRRAPDAAARRRRRPRARRPGGLRPRRAQLRHLGSDQRDRRAAGGAGPGGRGPARARRRAGTDGTRRGIAGRGDLLVRRGGAPRAAGRATRCGWPATRRRAGTTASRARRSATCSAATCWPAGGRSPRSATSGSPTRWWSWPSAWATPSSSC